MRDAAHCRGDGCTCTDILYKTLWLCSRCYQRHRARARGVRPRVPAPWAQSFRLATPQERAELDALRAELLAAWAPDAPSPMSSNGSDAVMEKMRAILAAMAK